MATIKQTLYKSIILLREAGIPTPQLDALVLLEYVLDKDKAFIYSHPDNELRPNQLRRYLRAIKRRSLNEPVAYITGKKEFFGLDFLVNKNVLIPRPETEWLVEEGTKFILNNETRIMNNGESLNIIDVGTGCGNIIISLIKSLNSQFIIHNSNFFAVDNERRALKVAKNNAMRLEAKNINFYFSDLLNNEKLPEKFDLILANLPYISNNWNYESGIMNNGGNSISYEPQNAIFAEDNGMSTIKRFLNQAKDRINKNGLMILETDPRNINQLIAYAKRIFKSKKITKHKDLAKKDRYMSIS